MNELGIFVFSGTGNTLMCARALGRELEQKGASVRLHRIEDTRELPGESDLVLCYPIHGFNAPNAMLRFCRDLPAGRRRVWFLKTSGEPLRLNDASSLELIRILTRKGCEVMGEFHYVMPYNMVFRHSDETASLMWKTALERIPAAAAKILEGTGTQIRPPAAARVMSALCRIEHLFYPANGRFYRVDEKKCLRCMRCVENCPAGNIRVEAGRIRFGGVCGGCVRCSFNCPAGAIHIGVLDFMRVSGPYDFGRDPGDAVPGRFCRKAYERYFSGEGPQ